MNRIFIVTILFVVLMNGLSTAQSGVLKSYYSNGKVETALSFVNDAYDGTSYWFYENGNLKLEKTYSLGKLNGWIKSYYETGLIKEEFFVNDGIKDGLHKTYYENGGLESVISYEMGRLVKEINISYDNNYIAPVEAYKAGNRQYLLQEKKEELLCDVDICPIPIGGLESIQDSLVYPEHALLYGLEGVVSLIATVNELGEVEKTEIIQGIGLGCEAAASEAVMKNKFLPGQLDGRAVQSHITLDVEFWLDDKSKHEYKRQIGADKIPINGEMLAEKNMKIAPADSTVTKDIASETESDEAVQFDAVTYQNFTCDLDDCPHPKGGLNAILENLELPEIARRVGLKGEVIIIATVDEYGFVRDTKVIKEMGHGCSDAAESALYSTEFYPGKSDGKPVTADVKIIIPIGK